MQYHTKPRSWLRSKVGSNIRLGVDGVRVAALESFERLFVPNEVKRAAE